jgi:hypothetical protein
MFWRKVQNCASLSRRAKSNSPGLNTAQKVAKTFLGTEGEPDTINRVTNIEGYPVAAFGEEVYEFFFGEHEEQLIVKIHVLSQFGTIFNVSQKFLKKFCVRDGRLQLS